MEAACLVEGVVGMMMTTIWEVSPINLLGVCLAGYLDGRSLHNVNLSFQVLPLREPKNLLQSNDHSNSLWKNFTPVPRNDLKSVVVS